VDFSSEGDAAPAAAAAAETGGETSRQHPAEVRSCVEVLVVEIARSLCDRVVVVHCTVRSSALRCITTHFN